MPHCFDLDPTVVQVIEAIHMDHDEFSTADVSLIPKYILKHLNLIATAKKNLRGRHRRSKTENIVYFETIHKTTEVLILATVAKEIPERKYIERLQKTISKVAKMRMLSRATDSKGVTSGLKAVSKASKELLKLYFEEEDLRKELMERNAKKRKAKDELVNLGCKKIKKG